LSRRRRGRSAVCMTTFPAARPPRARLPSSRRSGCGSCRRARFALEICARLLYNQTAEFAGVMELVDVLDSKSSAARRAGSSPATGTTASEEASTVPFPPRGENCTMLASSTYDGYSVSFGEGEWKNGERGKEHLPPDPSYKMNWEPVIGAGLVVICTVGIIAVAADDLTGVGVADDFLFGPLGAGVGEGLIMIFG
jgi:hypothetical protein